MDGSTSSGASKRNLNEDERASIDQPAVKSSKAGEAVPSLEVVELRQQLAAEKTRADELETRVDLASAMEEARTTVNLKLMRDKKTLETEIAQMRETHKKSLMENDALKGKMAKMEEDHQKSVAQMDVLKQNIEEMSKKHLMRIEQLNQQMRKEHKEKLAEVKARLESTKRNEESTEKKLESEKEALKSKIAEMIEKHQKRIDELTYQMREERDDHELKMQQLMMVNAQYEDEVVAARSVERVKGVELHLKADPTNILQLCHPDSSESTSLLTASRKIRDALKPFDEYSAGKGRRSGDGFLGELLSGNSLTSECGCCHNTYSQSQIIQHFLGEKHSKKVHDLFGAVSTAALDFWLDLLKPTDAVIAKLKRKKQQKEAAAAAGADDAAEPAQNVKNGGFLNAVAKSEGMSDDDDDDDDDDGDVEKAKNAVEEEEIYVE